ncbi:MAG: PilW family protein [Planctomycetota bacterium]|jgi:prepilin-type N-terminal cleavage/methylation domain-containing protein
MRQPRAQSGFTIHELLMALLVASVVLSAVATLASATTGAKEATDQMGREQSVLRQVTMRLNDQIMRANQVYNTSSSGFTMWHDINADGLKSADELTIVSCGVGNDTLKIGSTEAYWQCENISFGYDAAGPDTRLVTIWFDLDENGQTQRHTINARLRASDAHEQ